LVLRKGYHREIDSYSAFYENDGKTATGLSGYLRERGFTRVFIAGLALIFACATRPKTHNARVSMWS
jgi:nicotinamidase-related amidase